MMRFAYASMANSSLTASFSPRSRFVCAVPRNKGNPFQVPAQREDVDWEMVDACGQRCVRILLTKKRLAEGQLVLWWRNACKGDPPIDLSQIQDRSTSRKQMNASFTASLAQAQVAFRERVQQHQKIEVDVGNGSESDDEHHKEGVADRADGQS